MRRALQTAVLAASAVTAVGFLVTMLFPAQVVRIFNREDPRLVELGVHAIRISMIMQPLIGFQVVSASYFQAVGKPQRAMFLALSRQVLLLIPAMLILPRFFALDGVWSAIPTADLVSSLLTAAFLFFELRHLRARHAECVVQEPG